MAGLRRQHPSLQLVSRMPDEPESVFSVLLPCGVGEKPPGVECQRCRTTSPSIALLPSAPSSASPSSKYSLYVSQLSPQGALASAGVRGGDYIDAVELVNGDWRTEFAALKLEKKLQMLNKLPTGKQLQVTVRRVGGGIRRASSS